MLTATPGLQRWVVSTEGLFWGFGVKHCSVSRSPGIAATWKTAAVWLLLRWLGGIGRWSSGATGPRGCQRRNVLAEDAEPVGQWQR